MPTPPPTEQDVSFVRRAIRLAMNGRGHVEPNPMVGCVLVKDGVTIGEGWHGRFGGPHAEPTALADCMARGHDPAGATAYVTLEPCCHTNKKTPPCAPRLIEAKVARVVIGCLDPNPDVNGKGVAMLRAAGIAVDGPVLEGEAKQLIAPFLARVNLGRPYVTLKWAQTADGKVAGPGGRRMQISNPTSSRLVHQLRGRVDAIVVGSSTVAIDDPMLTPRGVETNRRPVRVVLDRGLNTPLDCKLVATAREWPTMVVTSPDHPHKVREALERCGVRVIAVENEGAASRTKMGLLGTVRSTTDGSGPRFAMEALFRELGVGEILVEPGPKLAQSFVEFGPVDRAWVFRSSRRVDDPTAPAAVSVPAPFVTTGELDVSGDRLTEYVDPRSAAFHAPARSADLVLALEGHDMIGGPRT